MRYDGSGTRVEGTEVDGRFLELFFFLWEGFAAMGMTVVSRITAVH